MSVYEPAMAVATIMAGLMIAVEQAARIAPMMAEMAMVWMSVPKYFMPIEMARNRTMPATQSFSIVNPRRPRRRPPAIGRRF